MPDELPVDSSWSDTYDGYLAAAPSRRGGGRRLATSTRSRSTPARRRCMTTSLWQLNLTKLAPRDRAIAEALLDAIDANGYLRLDLDELLEPRATPNWIDAPLEEIEAVLHRIQSFDPPGVGARSCANACCCSCASCRRTNRSATKPSGSANQQFVPCRATTSTSCAGVPSCPRTTLREALG
jgi:DNA-directed RNA polymerase specialized sigma54-like protein